MRIDLADTTGIRVEAASLAVRAGAGVMIWIGAAIFSGAEIDATPHAVVHSSPVVAWGTRDGVMILVGAMRVGDDLGGAPGPRFPRVTGLIGRLEQYVPSAAMENAWPVAWHHEPASVMAGCRVYLARPDAHGAVRVEVEYGALRTDRVGGDGFPYVEVERLPFVAIDSAAWGAADFDASGWVNGDDFDAFVAAFVAGDFTADWNRDGFVNGEDADADAEGDIEWWSVHSPDHKHYLDENDLKWKTCPQAMGGWFMSRRGAELALNKAGLPPGSW